MAIRDRALFTEMHDTLSSFAPEAESAYVFGKLPEDRTDHLSLWRDSVSVDLFSAEETETNKITLLDDKDKAMQASLRSPTQLRTLLDSLGDRLVYLDITGLEHRIWAAMLRVALTSHARIAVVYVEPARYTFSQSPTEGHIFDLSERVAGIAPLPGFASLRDVGSSEDVFVPLLGFEGTRLSHVIEHVQPSADSVIPIIGLPGFRPEYPFHAYQGNKGPLTETDAWHRVRYALANCPFSAMYELNRISMQYPRGVMRVAPIGTKPHGLGAVLFALSSERPVELIYDHPVRKAKRTSGTDRLFVYHIDTSGAR